MEIIASQWSSSGPTPWTFATIRVRNKPLVSPLAILLTRQAAQRCVVDLDYFRWGTDERVIPTVPGRWSSHQKPTRSLPYAAEMPVPLSGGTAGVINKGGYGGVGDIYDPALDPLQQDVAVGDSGEEIAVAILRDGQAFAFSSESYAYDAFGNPNWALGHGTYRVVVRVRGSSVNCERAFKLEYLSNDFSRFQLQNLID